MVACHLAFVGCSPGKLHFAGLIDACMIEDFD